MSLISNTGNETVLCGPFRQKARGEHPSERLMEEHNTLQIARYNLDSS